MRLLPCCKSHRSMSSRRQRTAQISRSKKDVVARGKAPSNYAAKTPSESRVSRAALLHVPRVVLPFRALSARRALSASSTRRGRLHRTVPPAAARALHRVEHAPRPVLEQVGHITDGVAVGDQVPSSGPVSVVVEPRSEDEVGGDAQEDAPRLVSIRRPRTGPGQVKLT